MNSIVSERFKLDQGVPQSSCLGHSPVFCITDHHGKS